MKKNCPVKVAMVIIAAAMFTSQFHIDTFAAPVSGVLPSGGVGSYLAGETSLAGVQTDSMTTSMPIADAVTIADMPEAEEEVTEVITEEDLYKDLVIAQVRAYVNIRSLPGEDGEVLGKLYNNCVGSYLGEENGWYLITSGSVTGYVKGEYCITGEEAVTLAKEIGTCYATIETETLFVRKEATTESGVMSMVPGGEDFVIVAETDGWAKISMEDGEGWVCKDYISKRVEFAVAESKEEEKARLKKEEEERRKAREAARESQTTTTTTTTTTNTTTTYTVGEGSELGVAVAEYALQFVGNPYKWGGTSLTNGADCSGFVLSVYANFGVALPHSSKSDRTQGSAVGSLEEALPGDLICYSGHVALYIGDGMIVHAANKKAGIIVSKADYKTILAIRRIF